MNTTKGTTEANRLAGWPEEVTVLRVNSSIDSTTQPSLFYAPLPPTFQGEEEEESCRSSESTDEIVSRAPLLVALHTWSSDYTQIGGGQIVFANWCLHHKWYFLQPNFRGPNHNPLACGSEVAIQDIIDAVDQVVLMQNDSSNTKVDTNRIYVVGASGGGHMALLLAAKYPCRWAGVSVWAPISDLEAWWHERSTQQQTKGPAYLRKYAKDIEAVVGGKPDGSDMGPINECRKRSPLAYLSSDIINQVNLDINAGIKDGRRKGDGGSVPFTHSLRAYDAITNQLIGAGWSAEFYEKGQCPSGSYDGPSSDPLYDNRKIHYRNNQDSIRITIFEGGHEILHAAALIWLAQQRLGEKAVWASPSNDYSSSSIDWLQQYREHTQSGK